jgi:predicted RNA binding protein YcfA (HicA-like mRNA interferase family)
VPRKLRELIADLKRAGFLQEPARGSHRKFRHPRDGATVILSGQEGDDAQRYQEKQVRSVIKERQK